MISSVDWTVTSARCWHLSTCQLHLTLLTMLSSSDDCKIYTESNSCSYLTDRTHQVCINNTLSEPQSLQCGVPQGSLLGARLYSMYVYLLSSIIVKHNLLYHSYADDTQIYLQCDNTDDAIKEAIHRLKKCIADVCSWMKNNSLKINEDKTEFTIFHRNKELTSRYTLQVRDNGIPLSTSTKILGVSLDSKMTLNQHISNTCRSAYYQTRRINSIRQYLTDNAIKTLTQSVVISRLDYCNSVCIGLPMKSIHRL